MMAAIILENAARRFRVSLVVDSGNHPLRMASSAPLDGGCAGHA